MKLAVLSHQVLHKYQLMGSVCLVFLFYFILLCILCGRGFVKIQQHTREATHVHTCTCLEAHVRALVDGSEHSNLGLCVSTCDILNYGTRPDLARKRGFRYGK